MSKSKYTSDFRAMVAQVYLDGEGSYDFLAQKYNVGNTTKK
jgi:transposase-like protein